MIACRFGSAAIHLGLLLLIHPHSVLPKKQHLGPHETDAFCPVLIEPPQRLPKLHIGAERDRLPVGGGRGRTSLRRAGLLEHLLLRLATTVHLYSLLAR